VTKAISIITLYQLAISQLCVLLLLLMMMMTLWRLLQRTPYESLSSDNAVDQADARMERS